MIRNVKKGRKPEKGEEIQTATKSVIIRSGGERIEIIKGEKYLVSGEYGCFEKPKPVKKKEE